MILLYVTMICSDPERRFKTKRAPSSGQDGCSQLEFFFIASLNSLLCVLQFQANPAKLSNISSFMVHEHEPEHLKPKSFH